MKIIFCFSLLLTLVSGSEHYKASLQLLRQDADSCNMSHSCFNESGEDEESPSCPVWYLCNVNDTCMCGPTLQGIISCDELRQRAEVLDCYCVTSEEDTGITIAGACFTNCLKIMKPLILYTFHLVEIGAS